MSSIPPQSPIAAPLDWTRRQVDYLRISITDRCNERCLYCMPQDLRDWKERDEILSYEEILRVVRVAVGLGFRKFRVTGGEPLVRKDCTSFLERMGAIPGVESFGLSTNAVLLAPVADRIRAAGIQSVNISLDSLDPETYYRITRSSLDACLAGIEAALRAGFPRVKLNTVLMRGVNETELFPLLRYAHERGAILRFIELMPVTTKEVLSAENFLSAGEARVLLARHTTLEPAEVKLGHGPAAYYRTAEGAIVGFIGAMSDLHFCDACNKVRLTADGKLRPCLGAHLEFDLKTVLRGGGTDDDLSAVFRETLGLKPKEHDFRGSYTPGRSMTAIGG